MIRSVGIFPDTVGIIGTPIIDAGTEIMYFWAKSYIDGSVGPKGVPAGVLAGELEWRVWRMRETDVGQAIGSSMLSISRI